jgi:hypothetical protein
MQAFPCSLSFEVPKPKKKGLTDRRIDQWLGLYPDTLPFRVSHTGRRGVHTLRFPGCRNTETHISTKLISGFRKSGFRDMRRQEVSHLSSQEPKLRSLSTLLSSFRGFANRDFAICEDRGLTLALEFPGAETPKPIHSAQLISGFHKSGFRDMRRQEVSHLSSQEPKLRSLSTLLSSFRGFANRDFAICEDRRSRT